jgi:antitoxin (DNA-binding transcriptional repressor) of toxin-antitoxin stability system
MKEPSYQPQHTFDKPDLVWFDRAMKSVNIQEAKTHLSRLVEEAASGEEIIVTKNGRPRARISALQHDPRPRRLGGWAGRARIAEDFDAPDERIIELVEGDPES